MEGVKTHDDDPIIPDGWLELPMGARCRLWFAWYPVPLGQWPRFQCDGWAWGREVLEWRCPSSLDAAGNVTEGRELLWSTPDQWYESADDIEGNIDAKLGRWYCGI